MDPHGLRRERLTLPGPGNAPSRERIFSCYPENDGEAAGCAEQVLTSIARRAYRRPVTADETARLMSLYMREAR